MAKADSGTSRRERNKTARWVVTIFITTIFVSGAISLLSDAVMENSSIAVAFLILLAIVLVGIVFDVIGVAVTSADEKPFHSMAARKVPGAREAISFFAARSGSAPSATMWWATSAVSFPAPPPRPLRPKF